MKVIDLFSGPGGTWRGFASLENGSAFHIKVSAEMDAAAHSTLTLRAFSDLQRNQATGKRLRPTMRFVILRIARIREMPRPCCGKRHNKRPDS
ncbi:MAG: DNA cytosine methyltransferase [Burkholderiales bacterium]|nr:DNA cytosine methyltransferase [Burkholderiales bacterium]